MTPEEQLLELKRGTVDLLVEKQLLKLLQLGRPLKVKAGFDPTRPDLHLGHTVLMGKMRQFQDFGHEVIFVVGDFTAQIGDPTGRSATRTVPTREEIVAGARTYAEQAFKILDEEKTRVVYNNDWLGKMGFDDVIRLAGKYPLARMLERDDFKKRFREHKTISIHELLYPLAQAQDSVELDCDIELGGTDQLFNLLVGRELMKENGQRPQCVMTTPILEGLNATVTVTEGPNGPVETVTGDKMSKSLDNYVSVVDDPLTQFGKLMSVSDGLMWRYYALLSRRSTADIAGLRAACDSGDTNPKRAKMALATEIVTRFHDAAAAQAAETAWQAQFSRGEVPKDMPEVSVPAEDGKLWLPKALAVAGLVKSSSEGRRRVGAGAVYLDGEKVTDVDTQLSVGKTYVVKAGKRAWAKVSVTP